MAGVLRIWNTSSKRCVWSRDEFSESRKSDADADECAIVDVTFNRELDVITTVAFDQTVTMLNRCDMTVAKQVRRIIQRHHAMLLFCE